MPRARRSRVLRKIYAERRKRGLSEMGEVRDLDIHEWFLLPVAKRQAMGQHILAGGRAGRPTALELRMWRDPSILERCLTAEATLAAIDRALRLLQDPATPSSVTLKLFTRARGLGWGGQESTPTPTKLGTLF